MQRHINKPLTLIALFGALSSLPALADHNSVWGAGFANMPNDIHNTRIEDDLEQDEWSEFVQYGEGADSVNRYQDSGSQTRPAAASGTASQQRGGRR